MQWFLSTLSAVLSTYSPFFSSIKIHSSLTLIKCDRKSRRDTAKWKDMGRWETPSHRYWDRKHVFITLSFWARCQRTAAAVSLSAHTYVYIYKTNTRLVPRLLPPQFIWSENNLPVYVEICQGMSVSVNELQKAFFFMNKIWWIKSNAINARCTALEKKIEKVEWKSAN